MIKPTICVTVNLSKGLKSKTEAVLSTGKADISQQGTDNERFCLLWEHTVWKTKKSKANYTSSLALHFYLLCILDYKACISYQGETQSKSNAKSASYPSDIYQLWFEASVLRSKGSCRKWVLSYKVFPKVETFIISCWNCQRKAIFVDTGERTSYQQVNAN